MLKYDVNKPAKWDWKLLPLKGTVWNRIINQVTPDAMSNSPFDTQAYTEDTMGPVYMVPLLLNV